MTGSRSPYDLTLVVHGASKSALLVNETGEVDSSRLPVKGVWLVIFWAENHPGIDPFTGVLINWGGFTPGEVPFQ